MNRLDQTDHELQTVSRWLAGTYNNHQQAMDQPVWFVPVRLWYLALPNLFASGIGFFTEQVNSQRSDQYYRSRVLQLSSDPLRLENYKLNDQAAWAGASQDPVRLSQLTTADFTWLPGCRIRLQPAGDRYLGKMDPGGQCRLDPTDTTIIEIDFELSATTFLTFDRGIDTITGRQTWGSKAGHYHYVREENR